MMVAEFPEFAKKSDRILGGRSHQDLIDFLGLNPEAGVIVPGSGGVRKMRWAVPGRGKRGGRESFIIFIAKNCRSSPSESMPRTRRRTFPQRIASR
jgi:hypothetical protein